MSVRPDSVIAVDIGATKAEVAVVTGTGDIIARNRISVTEAGDELFAEIARAINALQRQHAVSAIGVGTAGPMGRRGEWVSPLNIPQWRMFPLRESLERVSSLPVRIEGDVRALALAEMTFGAAISIANFASVVVSTGIGGALVMNGELLDGDSGNSGHIGHLNIREDGNRCSCGSIGCLESEASGWAIAQQTGVEPAQAPLDVRDRVAATVGRAVGSLASVLDFNHCFVAGSVALGYGERFFELATVAARAHATMHYSRGLSVAPSGLGSDGPILGAAVVGWRVQQ